ncbi:hypothetical protein H0H92_006728 [Tricholoma furcatifolium]|nr:hypothetical protein H0H92_006728 [Tricholoma furcatifolium]
MRLFSPLTLLSVLCPLLGISSAIRIRDPTRTKVSDARAISILAARQFKVTRDILTTCISIPGSTFALAAGIVDPSINDLSICVCTDNLDAWLATNANAQVLVNLLGSNTVSTVITGLLNTDGTSCDFPDNSTPGCTSSGTTARRRNLPKQIKTLAEAEAVCKSKSVCGIPGREKTLDFECVDFIRGVLIASTSGGGCVVPPPFPDAVRSTLGVDCGRLVGALESQCSNSKCIVTKCRDGLAINLDGTQCVPKTSTQSKRDVITIATPSPDVKSKLGAITNAVIALNNARKVAVQTPGTPAVTSTQLVQAAVGATTTLLKSNTVSAVDPNVQSLVTTMSRLHQQAIECDCVDKNVVDNVGTVIERAVDLHMYLLNNPLGTTARSASVDSVPITSTLPLDLDVGNLLTALGKITVAGNVNPPVVDKAVSLIKLALNLDNTPGLTNAGTSGVALPGGTTPASLTNPVALAASDLAASKTLADLLVNLNALLNANNAVTKSVIAARDVSPDTLVSLDRVGKAALDLKSTINAGTGASQLDLAPAIHQDKELHATLARVTRRGSF